MDYWERDSKPIISDENNRRFFLPKTVHIDMFQRLLNKKVIYACFLPCRHNGTKLRLVIKSDGPKPNSMKLYEPAGKNAKETPEQF